MEKLTFKFGLFLGFLITINLANLVNIVFNIINDGSLYWAFNGAFAVILSFVHSMWIEEVLND